MKFLSHLSPSISNQSITYYGFAKKFESGYMKHIFKRSLKFFLNLSFLFTVLLIVNLGFKGMKPTLPAIFNVFGSPYSTLYCKMDPGVRDSIMAFYKAHPLAVPFLRNSFENFEWPVKMEDATLGKRTCVVSS